MANEQNLKVPTSSQAREYGRKGGIASAKSKRDKRTMRETLAMLLELQLKDKNGKPVKSNITGDELSIKEAILTKTIAQALKGDQRSASTIIDLMGERTIKNEVTGKDGEPLIQRQLSSKEAQTLLTDLQKGNAEI